MHNFKKILPRVAVLLAFVFLLEAGIRFLYEPYTQYSIYARREYQSMKEDVDTLFCGTSKTYSGYDPAVYDSSTGAVSFNLGTGSQPLVTTKELLEDAFRVSPIKTVYLEVSLSTLQRGRNDSARIGASDRFVTLFGKLSSIFHETSSGVQIRKLLYSTRVTDYFDFSAVAANVSYKLSAESGQAPVMPDKEPQYLGRGFLNNDNVYSGKRYTDTNITIHSWKPRIHTQENKALLDEIITLCQEKGVEIILVSPPLPEVLLSHAGDMNHMHATYQAIADSHGIPFYDMNFYTEKNTVFNRELFRDIVHLNRNGAKIYTGLIAEIHESGDAYPTYFTKEYMGEVAEPAA